MSRPMPSSSKSKIVQSEKYIVNYNCHKLEKHIYVQIKKAYVYNSTTNGRHVRRRSGVIICMVDGEECIARKNELRFKQVYVYKLQK